MSIREEGGNSYAGAQLDIPEYLRDYSRKSYPAEYFADAQCGCSARLFLLAIDENEGAAVRTCTSCGAEHPIGDSGEYLEGAALEECGCPCGAEGLELTVGVALYGQTNDVRWFYIGARCPHCKMVGCYGDWKNEFTGYEALLSRA